MASSATLDASFSSVESAAVDRSADAIMVQQQVERDATVQREEAADNTHSEDVQLPTTPSFKSTLNADAASWTGKPTPTTVKPNKSVNKSRGSNNGRRSKSSPAKRGTQHNNTTGGNRPHHNSSKHNTTNGGATSRGSTCGGISSTPGQILEFYSCAFWVHVNNLDSNVTRNSLFEVLFPFGCTDVFMLRLPSTTPPPAPSEGQQTSTPPPPQQGAIEALAVFDDENMADLAVSKLQHFVPWKLSREMLINRVALDVVEMLLQTAASTLTASASASSSALLNQSAQSEQHQQSNTSTGSISLLMSSMHQHKSFSRRVCDVLRLETSTCHQVAAVLSARFAPTAVKSATVLEEFDASIVELFCPDPTEEEEEHDQHQQQHQMQQLFTLPRELLLKLAYSFPLISAAFKKAKLGTATQHPRVDEARDILRRVLLKNLLLILYRPSSSSATKPSSSSSSSPQRFSHFSEEDRHKAGMFLGQLFVAGFLPDNPFALLLRLLKSDSAKTDACFVASLLCAAHECLTVPHETATADLASQPSCEFHDVLRNGFVKHFNVNIREAVSSYLRTLQSLQLSAAFSKQQAMAPPPQMNLVPSLPSTPSKQVLTSRYNNSNNRKEESPPQLPPFSSFVATPNPPTHPGTPLGSMMMAMPMTTPPPPLFSPTPSVNCCGGSPGGTTPSPLRVFGDATSRTVFFSHVNPLAPAARFRTLLNSCGTVLKVRVWDNTSPSKKKASPDQQHEEHQQQRSPQHQQYDTLFGFAEMASPFEAQALLQWDGQPFLDTVLKFRMAKCPILDESRNDAIIVQQQGTDAASSSPSTSAAVQQQQQAGIVGAPCRFGLPHFGGLFGPTSIEDYDGAGYLSMKAAIESPQRQQHHHQQQRHTSHSGGNKNARHRHHHDPHRNQHSTEEGAPTNKA